MKSKPLTPLPEKCISMTGDSKDLDDETPIGPLAKFQPFIKISIFILIFLICVGSRVFSVIIQESIIHEYDPWFNYRVTERLVEIGLEAWDAWEDEHAWFPINRAVGRTLYPGLMITAYIVWQIINYVLMIPIHIREVCVFLAPGVSCLTALSTYLLAKTASGSSGAGLVAALLVAVQPTYLSRSVAGSYDNEAVCIFALAFSTFTFAKAVKSGKSTDAVLAAFSYYYLVISWGGYIFVLGCISVFIVVLVVLNRMDLKTYTAFSIFYILGNLLSLTVAFVGKWAVWFSSEHYPSHIAFIMCQLFMFYQFLKTKLPSSTFKKLAKLILYGIGLGALGVVLFLLFMGKSLIGIRIVALLNPLHSRNVSPLATSISEHASPTAASAYTNLHYGYVFAPFGCLVLLRNPKNERLFLILYCLLSVYFSSLMVRLQLVAGPAVAALGGIGLSFCLQKAGSSLRGTLRWGIAKLASLKKSENTDKKEAKPARRRIPFEAALVVMGLVAWILVRAVWYGAYYSKTGLSYSGIVSYSYNYDGENRYYSDELREAYYWLRKNTKEDDVVGAWWDYGYQLAGLANKSTVTDNNTWNNTHIGRIGMMFGSDEEQAYNQARDLGIDYVFIIFSGLNTAYGDDINKFMWMVRIAQTSFPHIDPQEYLNNGLQIGDKVAPKMRESLLYKLSYYRFRDIDHGQGNGYDKARNVHVGVDYV